MGYVLRTDSSRTIPPSQTQRPEMRPATPETEPTIVLRDEETPVTTIDMDEEARQRTPLGL